MNWKSWRVTVLASLFGLVVLYGVRAEDAKPTDEGKAAEFKGKSFDLKEKGEAAIILAALGLPFLFFVIRRRKAALAPQM